MIHLAIVGCGNMAHAHAQHLQKIAEARVVALVDPLTDRTEAFRQKYFPQAQCFASFDALLADESLDLQAVVLVTPHDLHYPRAKTALERGLHVLTEKPMVTNSKHACDLWRTVKRTGKLLAIAFQAPYSPEFAYLAELRDRGDMGKIRLVTAWLSQNWMSGSANTWRQDPARSGGGQMYDSGSHLLNAVTWILNEPVVEVACFYDRRSTPVDINAVAIAKFQSGALVSMTIGGSCPPFRTEIEIQTDSLLIITDQYGGKLEIIGHDSKRIYPHVVQDIHPTAAAGTPCRNFINAILGVEPLRAPVRYGVLLSTVMDALYEASDTQRIVRVQPMPDDIYPDVDTNSSHNI